MAAEITVWAQRRCALPGIQMVWHRHGNRGSVHTVLTLADALGAGQ